MPTRETPANAEAERVVVGSILLDNTAINDIRGLLKPEDFYFERNRLVFQRSCDLLDRGEGVDYSSLFSELQKHGEHAKVGLDFLAGLTDQLAFIETQVVANAKTIREASIRRQAITVATELAKGSYDLSVEAADAIEGGIRGLLALTGDGGHSGLESLRNLISGVGRDSFLHTLKHAKGIETPWPLFDRMLPGDGMSPGELIVIAARPGVGKTALAVLLAVHVAIRYAVAFFTIEMPWQSVGHRALTHLAGVPSKVIKHGQYDLEQERKIGKGLAALLARNLHIDDSADRSVPEIYAQCRKLALDHEIGCVVIDYLGLLKMPKEDRDDLRYAKATRELKVMAKELSVPVVLLAQLNREAVNKRAGIENLAGSDTISRDADVIAILEANDELPNKRWLDVRKVRDGKPAKLDMYWRPELMQLTEESDMEDSA